jgi:hypothetical protein
VSTERTERTSGGLSLSKKIFSFVGGWFLVLYPLAIDPPKEYGTFHIVIILMGGALVGVPGVTEVLARFGIGVPGLSSPSAPPASPPPVSQSPSSNAPGGKG